MFDNVDKCFNWDKFTEYKYTNLTCVHPLKQNDVGIIVEELSKDSNIKYIVVFGSAVRFDCDQRSDLDIYIERYDIEKKISRDFYDCIDFHSDVDLVCDLSKNNRLYKEILKTGILVHACEDVYTTTNKRYNEVY